MSMRRGFTLFEVLISMLVMAIAVLAVVGILPSGIAAQERARYQIYASALALEVAHDQAIDTPTQYGYSYAENQFGPGDAVRSRPNVALANPLEYSFRALKPLPAAIAGRLDSEGDEIAGLVAAGRQIYYADLRNPPTVMGEGAYEAPGETIGYKLLCGILGEPQNGLIRHPEIAWPYRDALLAPPQRAMDSWYDPDVPRAFGAAHRYATSPGVGDNPSPRWIVATRDSDFRDGELIHRFDIEAGDGWHAADYLTLGAFDFWRNFHGEPRPLADEELLEAEVCLTGLAAAWFYAEQLKGIDLLTDGPADPTDPSYVPSADEVRAFRYAAYFARRLTSALFAHGPDQFAVWGPSGRMRFDLETGSLSVDLRKEGHPWTATVELDPEMIDLLHEKAIRCAMNFQARFPYRWDVTRPIERSIAWDHPLLQYDPVADNAHPYLTDPGGIRRWPVIAPVGMRTPIAPPSAVTDGQALSAYERSLTSSNRALIAGSWAGTSPGNPRRFTATRSWAAADRCRQLVFWVADWQGYEDFEEQPSEPFDSARYTFTADGRLQNIDRVPFRIPEGDCLWADPTRVDAVNWHAVITDWTDWRTGLTNFGSLESFWGRYGADRNGNRRFDRGPLPATARIRAETIARFNLYESIGPGSMVF